MFRLDKRRRQLLELLLFKSYCDLKAENADLRLGFLWWILEPMLQMVIFYVVFELFLHRGTEHFIVFLLIGQVLWRWFQLSFARASRVLAININLIQQVYIPKSFFATSVLLNQTAKFLITLGILLPGMWAFGYHPNMAYVHLPLLFAATFFFIAGTVYMMAAIQPFFPDLRMLQEYGLRGLMFLSGVFYEGSKLPESVQKWFYLNPLAGILEAWRAVLINASAPDYGMVLYAAVLGVVFTLLGKMLFRKFNTLYPRTLRG